MPGSVPRARSGRVEPGGSALIAPASLWPNWTITKSPARSCASIRSQWPSVMNVRLLRPPRATSTTRSLFSSNKGCSTAPQPCWFFGFASYADAVESPATNNVGAGCAADTIGATIAQTSVARIRTIDRMSQPPRIRPYSIRLIRRAPPPCDRGSILPRLLRDVRPIHVRLGDVAGYVLRPEIEDLAVVVEIQFAIDHLERVRLRADLVSVRGAQRAIAAVLRRVPFRIRGKLLAI